MVGTGRQGHYPSWHTASAQGPRTSNADAVGAFAAAAGPGIVFALADGVGDDPGAAKAARTAASVAVRTPVAEGPVAAVLAAQRAVRELGGTGDSVLVVAMPTAGGYRVAWVGDARAYAWDGFVLRQVTTDHTLAEYFRAQDQPTAPHMEHIVTTSVRTAHENEIGTAEVAGGGLLLTSDGVHKALTVAMMAAILAEPGKAAAALTETAIAVGGTDNATAIFVEPPPSDLVTDRFTLAA
ncbi:PP2C family protein-serine/threonine phosphatase [Amycolatopsis sp. H20-H5]|uniref:PP2C family protein-serine/threonine phosphatase n=1 Tax=Amycolatopsis sp. H20-H5 TaxID=3046309 RepID=UPI002DB9C4A0|nr:serine/threonine protein phosphatase [Amycolatopsis sp. H20-H5]MEC3982246.1 serine/threonine protein phosphatase [Amycolatopsis sp. H20-H5]